MEHEYSFISITISCHVSEVSNKAGQSMVMMEPLNTTSPPPSLPWHLSALLSGKVYYFLKKCTSKGNKSTNNYLKKLIGGIIQLCSMQRRKVLLITTELNRTFFSLNLVIFQGELLLTHF